jgi:hypothetical protein
MIALLNEVSSVVASIRTEHERVISHLRSTTIAANVSRNTDFDARLLAFSSSHVCPSQNDEYNMFEECLSLSLMLWIGVVLRNSSASSDVHWHIHITGRIKKLLFDMIPPSLTGDNADLLLWMIFMCFLPFHHTLGEPAGSDPAAIDNSDCLLNLSHKLCDRLRISSLAVMKEHLKRFLWLDVACETAAYSFWAKMGTSVLVSPHHGHVVERGHC